METTPTERNLTERSLTPIRVLDLSGSPHEMGLAHGRAFAEEIRAYTDERIELVTSGLWSGGPMTRTDVLELAERCLPAHQAHSQPLYDELVGIAEGAGITPAEAVVVGGFTDFVDTVRAEKGGAHPPQVIEDDCTAVIVPDHRASGSGFFAQTWDMHSSATEHVVLLRIEPEDGPRALIFTTTGCLGQIGMNELGVCVGINNLVATDGKVGVTWPSVVRQALTLDSATAAHHAILQADLAGAHNFLLFDAQGQGFNIEAMPSVRPTTQLQQSPIVHTNHTLFEAAKAVEGPRADVLNASSIGRLKTAEKLTDRPEITAQDLMELTREPGFICQVPTEPYHIESSGAVVMRPRTKEFWATWGQPLHNEFQSIGFP